MHARFISITNTNTFQIEGNITHDRFLLAQATMFPAITLHCEINLVHARFPSSPKISTSPIKKFQGERNLMCSRFPSSINISRKKAF